MKISVLCAATKSVYKTLPGLDVYDQERNAWKYRGSNPVICHPPCRGWSTFMSQFANPKEYEMDLAYMCVEKILQNGGVMEHPAHSKFLKLFIGHSDLKIIKIQQDWFGYPIQKKTWLLMPESYVVPEFPFVLMPDYKPGEQKKKFENMTRFQRHETLRPFAEWLITLVKQNSSRNNYDVAREGRLSESY